MNSPQSTLAVVLRWVARLGTVLSIGLLAAFAFGGNEDSPLTASGSEAVGLLFFPLGIVLGMILGWRNERWGGLLTLISLLAFYAWHFSVSGDFPRGGYFALFAAPGLMFLLTWCLTCCCGGAGCAVTPSEDSSQRA